MHVAAQRVDNREQQLEFSTKAMVRPRTRADHGHSRGNKRTEGKEEAGYRSPTWSMLRALHKINKAKMMMIAFITFKSSLVPLLEGL